MELLVKKICKDQGITLKELAEKIGIARESLTRAITGNPTLSTLQNIADSLEVEIWDLFNRPGNEINGFIECNGKVHKIQSKKDLENLLNLIE